MGSLTGPPVSPSCSLTLTMSIGWMIQVAAMPDRPPFTNGLAASHAAGGLYSDDGADMAIGAAAPGHARCMRKVVVRVGLGVEH
eukprot:363626-Chlamydomonas_euryale.AAC.11